MRSQWITVCCAVLFMVLLAGSGVSWAADGAGDVKNQWQVATEPGEPWPSYWLTNKDHPELKQEMFLAGPIAGDRPWISDVVEADKARGIYLIVYYAGQPGTHELVDVYYALIYDNRNHRILGHYPYSRKSLRGDYSPQWHFETRRIRIVDEGEDLAVINY
ncbi:hypothetical protein [uncultured Pseudodesulfovibrio sp.]|uniref:hypothetical protein n=1 Tax=uncultured Pseudodesulfovibrio sp. TaxID=2035858 RepID=UPI0029C67755|nr:hypothetical protein [uncultured Pseudodesulfovibrio sp.]